MIPSHHLVPTALLWIVSALSAQTTTWTGQSSMSRCWQDINNWSSGVPTSAGAAIIPAMPAGREPDTCSSARCDSIVLQAGALLRVSGPLTVRALTLQANARIDLQFAMTISGPVDMAAGAAIEGPSARVELTGTGLVRGNFPEIEFRATDRTFDGVNVDGEFTQFSGIVRVVSLNIMRAADLRTVVSASATSRLIVDTVNWRSPVTDPPRTILCYGAWYAGSGFVATEGTVEFQGSADISMPGTLHDVVFGGAQQLAGPLLFTGSARIDGTVTNSSTELLISAPVTTAERITGSGSVDYLALDGSVTIAGITVDNVLDIRALSSNITVESTVTVRQDAYVRNDTANLRGLQSAVVRVLRNCDFAGRYEMLGVMEVHGNLRILPSATFTPVEGRIVFRGTGTKTLTSTTTQPERAAPNVVVVEPGVTLNVSSISRIRSLQVSGTVNVGPWTNGAPASGQVFAEEVQVARGGAFTYADTATPFRVGAFRLEGTANLRGPSLVFAGDVTLAGTLTTDTGAAWRLEGSGAASGTFPSLTVQGVDRRFTQATVQGSVTHTTGALRVGQLSVTGSFDSRGSVFAGAGGTGDTLTVAQNVVLATSTPSDTPPATIRVGGNWQAAATYRPTSGLTLFEGSGARTAQGIGTAALQFADLQVASATVLAVNGDLSAREVLVLGRLSSTATSITTAGDLEIAGGASFVASTAQTCTVGRDLLGGTFTAPGATLNIGRHLQVTNGGLTIGGGRHRIGGSWDSSATLTFGSGASLAFTGSGTILSPTSPLPSVEISGNYGISNATIAGSLTQTETSPRIDIVSARVAGDVTLAGGMLTDSSLGAGLLDVGGSFTSRGAGTSRVNPPPQIRCAGDWNANDSFAPTAGRVVLYGSGVANLRALQAALSFHELVLQRQVRLAAPSSTVGVVTLRIDPSGHLDIGGRTLALYVDILDCRGTLSVGAGGRINVGGATTASAAVTVAVGGTLRMVGAPLSPAVWRGTAAATYGIEILGTCAASEFEFRDMNAAGIRIAASATLAPAPLDLRGGVFGSGAVAPGAVLLHIDRPTGPPPVAMHDIVFDNFPATATYNVRSRGSGRITFTSANGNFYGAAFTDDPGRVVDWAPFQRTAAEFLLPIGSLGRVHLLFRSLHEVDDVVFAVWRGDAAAGPFATLVGAVNTLGAPRTYEVIDRAPVSGREHHYLLVALHRRGVARPLLTTSARALPPAFGPVRLVGQGALPDIATALQSGPGTVVLVDSGTYPPFRLTGSAAVRPLPGADVRIDASSGPVVVEDLTGDADLHDLTITAGSGPALVVQRCRWQLVLDKLRIRSSDPTGALRIVDSPSVVLQWNDVTGGPTALARSGAIAWGGNYDELRLADRSRLLEVELAATRSFTDPTSSRQTRPGRAPRLDGATLWQTGRPVVLALQTYPGDFFAVYASIASGQYDLSPFVSIDMVLLLGLEALQQPLFVGFADASGYATFALPLPLGAESWGLSISTQMVSLGLRDPVGRFGNVHRAVVTP